MFNQLQMLFAHGGGFFHVHASDLAGLGVLFVALFIIGAGLLANGGKEK